LFVNGGKETFEKGESGVSFRIIISCVIVFTGTVIAADANDLDYKPGELIVRFAPKANGKQ